MKKWILAVLFCCVSVQADMLDALKAYENKDYATAEQQFSALLPFGNELAAYNLGAMAYQGEGQDKNFEKALAYFMLAAELAHPSAKDLLERLISQATDIQKEQAYQQFERLKQHVVILPVDVNQLSGPSVPQPIRRIEPKYPVNAARSGVYGYVKLRLLVDANGEVAAIDTLDAYPQNVFERVSIQAVKKWRYEPSDSSHIFKVELSFTLNGGIKVSAVEKTVEELNLWNYAVLGSPQHQLALGMLLSLVSAQSHNGFWYDPDLPLTNKSDFSIFEKRARVKAEFDGFWGYAVVRVDKKGVIVEQLNAKLEPKSEVTNLVGLKLSDNVDSEVYRLYRRSDLRAPFIYVEPSLEVPRTMSATYWWAQAAKNGNPDAQRIMAAYNSQWENYLLSQGNAEVMAWAGTRLLLEGNREQGMKLLEQAIAKNYEPAVAMKKQFM